MIECDVTLVFEVEGPFLSRSSSMGGYGIDAAALRDARGCPLLPGSHVRGRIREALRELDLRATSRPELEQWFGPEVSRDDVQADQGLRRFAWQFSDFTTADFPRQSALADLLTRIEIDEQSGTVQRGAMCVVECGVPPGQRAKFSGTVTLAADGEGQLDAALRWLRAAAGWVPSLGAFRNVGFGRVRNVDVEVAAVRVWAGDADAVKLPSSGIRSGSSATAAAPKARSSAPASHPETRLLRVVPDAPFCTGGKRRDRNVFASLRHLPGAVLKGTVAHQLERILGVPHRRDLTQCGAGTRWELLCRVFSKLRFCTAFPVKRGTQQRPLVAPVSLFKGIGDQVRDAALVAGPFLVGDASKAAAPAFAPDWKTSDTPGWDTGLADPDVELRIRTAIDSASRRVRQEHLFAQELVWPRQTNYDAAGRVEGEDALDWLGTVGIAGAGLSSDEQARFWEDLEALCELAVLRVGKTKARACLTIEDGTPDGRLASTTKPHQSQWIVVLQSSALMIDPRKLHDSWCQSIDATEALYCEYFDNESGKVLRLVRYFADQQWQGGFLAHRANRKAYKPFLTTEPGSVFVLQASDEAVNGASKILDDWLKHGLPLPDWAVAEYGEAFETNPFLPRDGAGEIVVNVPLQIELAPGKDEICLM